MNKIQIIYSTNKGQFVGNFPITDKWLQSSDVLKACAIAGFYGRSCFLNDDWKKTTYENAKPDGSTHISEDVPELPEIHKISCCVITDEDNPIETPDWYHAINGKFYWDDINPDKPRPW